MRGCPWALGESARSPRAVGVIPMKLWSTVVVAGVIGSLARGMGTYSAKPKQQVPAACRQAYAEANQAFAATDEIFGDPTDPARSPSSSHFNQLVESLTDEAAQSQYDQMMTHVGSLWVAEGRFYDALTRCRAKVKGV